MSKFILLVCLIILNTAQALERYSYIGRAYDSKDQLSYTEEHVEEWDVGQNILRVKTTYRNAQKETIAEFNNNFASSLKFPEVQFKDFRNGEEHGVLLENNSYYFYRKADKDARLERHEYSISMQSVAGQGFHFHILSKLSALKAGDEDIVDFAIPGRLTSYTFKYRVESIQGDVLKIKLFVNNFFLRMIAPSLSMSYSLKRKKLLEYQGLSNLKNNKGHTQKVRIEFDHP